MANFVVTNGLNDGNFQSAGSARSVLLSRTLDFAKFTTAGAAGAAADTADIIDLPASFVVEDVFSKVVLASTTASSVFGIGDATDSVFYMAATTAATSAVGTVVKTGAGAAGKFHDIATVTTLGDGLAKVYATGTTIRVVLGATAPLNGKIRVFVRGFLLV